MSARTYIGTVKSWNPEKGWGHIDCPETHALYGKDMFLLRGRLVGVDSVNKGAQVQFTVQDGAKGPEAATVQLLTPMNLGLTPASGSAYEASAAFGSFGQVGPSTAEIASTYIGTVKSFNSEKGWGHIECSSTHAIFGKDVFLMRNQIVGGMNVTQGTQVSFSYIQGSRGPEAVNVKIISGNEGGDAADFADNSFALMRAMGGMFDQQSLQQMQQSLGQQSSVVGMGSTQSFTGVVKSFDEGKGWGHIMCDATRAVYQKDMFFMRSALQGQMVTTGDTVQFTIIMGIKGPEASSILVVGQAGMYPGGMMTTGQASADFQQESSLGVSVPKFVNSKGLADYSAEYLAMSGMASSVAGGYIDYGASLGKPQLNRTAPY